MDDLTWNHSHKKNKQRGCMLSESVASLPAVMKWIYLYLFSIDQVPITFARDCLLDPKKIIQRKLGRMHRMGVKLPWLCAFVPKSSWESFKPPARRLSRQPDHTSVPRSSAALTCEQFTRLVSSVRKSRTLEKYY